MNFLQRMLVVLLLGVISILTHTYFCDWRETNIAPIITFKKTYLTRQKITLLQNEEKAQGLRADGEIYNPYGGHFSYYGISPSIGIEEGMFGPGKRTALILGVILPLLLAFGALFVILGSPELVSMLRRTKRKLNTSQPSKIDEVLSNTTSKNMPSTGRNDDLCSNLPDAGSGAASNLKAAIGSRTAPADPMPSNSTRVSMGVHAVTMLIAAPLALGLMHGLLTEFSSPRSAAFAVLKFTEWLGSSVLALAIAFIILFFRKTIVSWTVLLVLIALSANSMHYTKQKIAQANASVRQANSGSPNVPSSQSGKNEDGRVYVNEVVENLPPHLAGAHVNDSVIAGMNKMVVDDYLRKLELRLKNKPDKRATVRATAQTIRVNTEGHVLYVTELTVHADDVHPQNIPKLKVFWNIRDNQIKRVICSFPEQGFPWRRGECGKQIAKTFNWDGWWQR